MWNLAGKILESRLLLGTTHYPSLAMMTAAIQTSGAQIITLSIQRQTAFNLGGEDFWQAIKKLNCFLLPNTAGCRNANMAIKTAEISRELFNTSWIKLEVIGDEHNLQADPIESIKAAKILVEQGFEVFPYCTDDLVICQKLVDVGCKILMPWAAPIGSGKGLLNPYALATLRHRLSDITLIVDAGMGRPSDAVQVMELGFDGVLLNTAVAFAQQPVAMAQAFRHAIIAGHEAYRAGIMPERNVAHPSTSLIDTPFWQQENKV
jgi:thiazole synthase